MRFKDPNHVSSAPKVWTAPNGRRIEWRSDQVPFSAFYATVSEYHAANGFAVPESAVVEDTMCRQMPRWACVDDGYHAAPANLEAPRRSGCSACNKRR